MLGAARFWQARWATGERKIEDSFSLIVFLIVPTEIRVDRLRKRENENFGAANREFLQWAAQYDEGRLPGRSLAMHERWLSHRRCSVLRIEGDVCLADSVDWIATKVKSLP